MKNQLNTHVRLMAIAVFFVLLTGLSSLFLMNSMRHEQDLMNQSQQKLLTATLAVEDAHTQFKIQVQEWKNLLLRGNNPEDYTKYYGSFNHQTDQVQMLLNTEKSELDNNVLNDLNEVINQHKTLVKTYQETLATAKLDSLQGIVATDKSVRGIDRTLDNLFPQLTKNITQNLEKKIRQDNESHAKSYEKHTLLIISFVSISIIFIILSFWIGAKKNLK